MDAEVEKWFMTWLNEYLNEVKQQRAALDGISLKMTVVIQKLDQWDEHGLKVVMER